MRESKDRAAGVMAPVIRRETSGPFPLVPTHKSEAGSIGASLELTLKMAGGGP